MKVTLCDHASAMLTPRPSLPRRHPSQTEAEAWKWSHEPLTTHVSRSKTLKLGLFKFTIALYLLDRTSRWHDSAEHMAVLCRLLCGGATLVLIWCMEDSLEGEWVSVSFVGDAVYLNPDCHVSIWFCLFDLDILALSHCHYEIYLRTHLCSTQHLQHD